MRDIETLFAKPVVREDDATLVARVLDRSSRRDRHRLAVLGGAALIGTITSVVGVALASTSGAVPEAVAVAASSVGAAIARLPLGDWQPWATLTLAGAVGLGALLVAGSRVWRAE